MAIYGFRLAEGLEIDVAFFPRRVLTANAGLGALGAPPCPRVTNKPSLFGQITVSPLPQFVGYKAQNQEGTMLPQLAPFTKQVIANGEENKNQHASLEGNPVKGPISQQSGFLLPIFR